MIIDKSIGDILWRGSRAFDIFLIFIEKGKRQLNLPIYSKLWVSDPILLSLLSGRFCDKPIKFGFIRFKHFISLTPFLSFIYRNLRNPYSILKYNKRFALHTKKFLLNVRILHVFIFNYYYLIKILLL